jgi:DHA1 family bicyclomycin/chloramphenicol resistance-like MFS transporter
MNQSSSSAMIILTVILMDILTGMEFDLFVPGFAQLQNHFNLTVFWVEALLSVNFIGYCIGLFFVGFLADNHARKSIILMGLCAFITGSLFCLSKNIYGFVLLGRLLQGFGIAAPAVLSFLIIADRYPLQKQQSLMGILNGSLNIAAGAAPVIGSYITLHLQWRGNFIALLLLGVLVLVMTLFFIPVYKIPENNPKTWLSGYKSVFQKKPILLMIGTLVIMFVPYWIFVGISPLLYIKNFHLSLPIFGLYQGVLAFSFAIGSIIFGLVIGNYSQKKWLSIGIIIFIMALLAMGWVSITNSHNPRLITLSMLIFVMGQIIPSTILYPLCLNLMPEAKAKISAIMQGGRLILTALILQVVGYFYNGSFQYTGMIIFFFILIIIFTQYCMIKSKNIHVDTT